MGETPQTAKNRGTSVALMLSVRNGARAVEFYKAAFGAQVLFRHDDPKAGVVARLSLGEMRLLADGRAFQFQPRDFWGVELQE